MSAALEITGLRKRFGELPVLDGVDLSVADRGVHAIIGPNGAGKTTLFNCITGAVAADAGTVSLRGHDITRLSVVGRVRLGLVRTFQVSRIFESISASENVRLALYKRHLGRRSGAWLSAATRRRLEDRCSELLHDVGLDRTDQDIPAGRLSHADRRAVEVAMALACDPVVLCLDEPTAGVGIGEAEQLAELIGRLGERMAVLLIEHRMSLVRQVSEHVTVLAFGSVLADGTPAAVANDRRVQDAYLGRAGGATSESTGIEPVAVDAPPSRRNPSPRGNRRHAEFDLTLTGVSSFYGSSHVLHGVTLVAPQGEVTSVLGRNGAGKTTALATIMNLVQARSGSIRLGQHELIGRSTHAVAKLGISLVPESRWVFPDLTVEENIRLAAGGKPNVDQAYAEFPALAERRHAKGSQLSGGQQQMVACARALVRDPSVVLLDEPTQGLSPHYVEVVIAYIGRLRERGVTVVLVEQSLDVVAAVSDTVYLMTDGRISAQIAGGALADNDELVRRHLLLEPDLGGHDQPALTQRRQRGVTVP